MKIVLINRISIKNILILIKFCILASIFIVENVNCSDSLPTCKKDDFKYDFTECDAYGGKWRVMVPNSPGRCTGPTSFVPTRVHNCYTSCEGGQFFNKSTLFCENCQPGHYSLSGGIVFDNFNDSIDSTLPEGFQIITEPRNHLNSEWIKCPEWHVDPKTGNLISMIEMKPDNSAIGCISVITHTVKVVKRGRFRFSYYYKTPNNMPLSLLFSFNYRLYGGIGVIEDDLQTNIKFPPTSIENNFETIDLQLNNPGLYIFTWKSIVIKNFHNYFGFSVSNMNFDNYYGKNFLDSDTSTDIDEENLFQNNKKRTSIAMIRIKKIIIEGVAYASECTPCEPGTYAPEPGMKECILCPKNTAYNGTGAINCTKCDPITEYAAIGSSHCSKKPICGDNDFYSIPIGKCNPKTLKQEIQFKWIEPRICVDLNNVFPRGNIFKDCSTSLNNSATILDCDLGMERKSDSITTLSGGEYCQFCPDGYYRDENMQHCKPCPPVTNPYYALWIRHWNNSLPGWSNPSSSPLDSILSSQEEDDPLADNPTLLNSYFSRQCFRSTEDVVFNGIATIDDNSINTKSDCISGIAWQTFQDYIRTGASASLDSYLVLSLTIPSFRSVNDTEISFTFETNCDKNDQCLFLFIETRPDESDLRLQDFYDKDFNTNNNNNNNNANNPRQQQTNRKKFSFSQQTINKIVKDWTQSTDGTTSYRYKINRNTSISFSWIFKRTTSFQSYAKIYSLLLTGSIVGSAIRCQPCPVLSESSTQCVSCPHGQYLQIDNFNGNQSEIVNDQLLRKNFNCKNCPKNHILNASTALSLGIKSCIACGENLVSDNETNICYSNCLITFNQNDHYDLSELQQPILYKGINLFTSGGTQYTNLFKISLCGNPKHDDLSTCLNNITVFADDSSGVRSYICRSTIIPDESKIFSAQSASLGDELIRITRENKFEDISVHKDFLYSPEANKYDKDYYLFFKTQTPTPACPNGRKLIITMRCIPGIETRVKTPNSCPDGTCNGCDFHLLIETSTAAACRLCRPYSFDYEMVIGECIDGLQQVHYLNPKGCSIFQRKPNITTNDNRHNDGDYGQKQYILQRPCSLLLPKQVQIGLALAMLLGLLLLLLVFHFWNKNRSLEYKYTKLIENTSEGKGNDDLSFDNCCVEDDADLNNNNDDGDHQQQQQQMTFKKKFNADPNNNKNINNKNVNHNDHSMKNPNNNNRLGKKHEMKQFVIESQEMKQLFPDAATVSSSSSSTSCSANKIRTIDDEGYETIHLISATNNNSSNVTTNPTV